MFLAATIGMQAMGEGIRAYADRQQMEAQGAYQHQNHMEREYHMHWRNQDAVFKGYERYRRQMKHKRHLVDQRSTQLSLLAELAALQAAFQMVMIYEQGLPSVTEYWYSDALLLCWGISCLVVTGTDLCVMIVAALVNFGVLEVSSREGFQEMAEPKDQYHLDGSNPTGFVVHPHQFQHLWETRYDRLFILVVRAFSFTVPAFMLNLGMLCIVKFYLWEWAKWISFTLCFVGIAVWYRCHSALISHLTWRPADLPPHVQVQMRHDGGVGLGGGWGAGDTASNQRTETRRQAGGEAMPSPLQADMGPQPGATRSSS